MGRCMSELPARLRLPKFSRDEIEHFHELCDEIADRSTSDERLKVLLDEWNASACRVYAREEFPRISDAIQKKDFVRQALVLKPRWIEDLRYKEACDGVRAVISALPTAAQLTHIIAMLDCNLPNSNVSDLIYWPNEWFDDEKMLQVELSAEQVVGYAMARSGRRLEGAPSEIALPFPMPARAE
jgi:hypothetical protein